MDRPALLQGPGPWAWRSAPGLTRTLRLQMHSQRTPGLLTARPRPRGGLRGGRPRRGRSGLRRLPPRRGGQRGRGRAKSKEVKEARGTEKRKHRQHTQSVPTRARVWGTVQHRAAPSRSKGRVSSPRPQGGQSMPRVHTGTPADRGTTSEQRIPLRPPRGWPGPRPPSERAGLACMQVGVPRLNRRRARRRHIRGTAGQAGTGVLPEGRRSRSGRCGPPRAEARKLVLLRGRRRPPARPAPEPGPPDQSPRLPLRPLGSNTIRVRAGAAAPWRPPSPLRAMPGPAWPSAAAQPWPGGCEPLCRRGRPGPPPAPCTNPLPPRPDPPGPDGLPVDSARQRRRHRPHARHSTGKPAVRSGCGRGRHALGRPPASGAQQPGAAEGGQ